MHFRLLALLVSLCCGTAAHGQAMPRLIPYLHKDLWGYCDSNKQLLIAPQWKDAKLFFRNKAIVSTGSNYGLIDTTGRYIIPPGRNWDGVVRLSMQFAPLNCHDGAGHFGYIDTNNKEILPLVYDPTAAVFHRAQYMRIDVMIASRNRRYGVARGDGKTLIPFAFDTVEELQATYPSLSPDSLTYFLVKKDGRCGVVDTGCRYRIPMIYNSLLRGSNEYRSIDPGAGKLSEFFVAVTDTGTGVIDGHNNVLVPCRYDSVLFCYGIAGRTGFYYRSNGLWGFAGIPGHFNIPPVMAAIPEGGHIHADSTVMLLINGKATLFSKTGDLLLASGYTGIEQDSTGRLIAYKMVNGAYYWASLSRPGYRTGAWHKVKAIPASFWLPVPKDRMYCGGGHNDNIIWLGDQPVYIYGHGGSLHVFKKDNYEFEVLSMFYQSNGGRGYYYVVEGKSTDAAKTVYAVVDTGLNYIMRPQSRYRPIAGNLSDNIVVVQHGALYGLTDTLLHIHMPLQRRRILYGMRYNNKYYAVADSSTAAVNEHPMSSGRNILVDSAGVEVTAFRHKRLPGSSMGTHTHADGRFDSDHGHYIFITNSADKQGIMAPDGTVQFPAISFHYQLMYPLGRRNFLCHSALVDGNDKELFKGVRFGNGIEYPSANELGVIRDENGTLSPSMNAEGLRVLRYEAPGKLSSFLYISRYGDIYADGLGTE